MGWLAGMTPGLQPMHSTHVPTNRNQPKPTETNQHQPTPTARCPTRAPCATSCGQIPTTGGAGASRRGGPGTPLGRWVFVPVGMDYVGCKWNLTVSRIHHRIHNRIHNRITTGHLGAVQPHQRPRPHLPRPPAGHGGLQLEPRAVGGDGVLGAQLLLPLRYVSTHGGAGGWWCRRLFMCGGLVVAKRDAGSWRQALAAACRSTRPTPPRPHPDPTPTRHPQATWPLSWRCQRR
jgi:hypothetical protein